MAKTQRELLRERNAAKSYQGNGRRVEIGMEAPDDLRTKIQQMVAQEMNQYAARQGRDIKFEDEDDFEWPEEQTPLSGFEMTDMEDVGPEQAAGDDAILEEIATALDANQETVENTGGSETTP